MTFICPAQVRFQGDKKTIKKLKWQNSVYDVKKMSLAGILWTSNWSCRPAQVNTVDFSWQTSHWATATCSTQCEHSSLIHTEGICAISLLMVTDKLDTVWQTHLTGHSHMLYTVWTLISNSHTRLLCHFSFDGDWQVGYYVTDPLTGHSHTQYTVWALIPNPRRKLLYHFSFDGDWQVAWISTTWALTKDHSSCFCIISHWMEGRINLYKHWAPPAFFLVVVA